MNEMNEMNEVPLPCPFCYDPGLDNPLPIVVEEHGLFFVECPNCRATSGRAPYRRKAIRMWDRRSQAIAQKIEGPGIAESFGRMADSLPVSREGEETAERLLRKKHAEAIVTPMDPKESSKIDSQETPSAIRKVKDTLRWWIEEKMSNYTDRQYGKGELVALLKELDELPHGYKETTIQNPKDPWFMIRVTYEDQHAEVRIDRHLANYPEIFQTIIHSSLSDLFDKAINRKRSRHIDAIDFLKDAQRDLTPPNLSKLDLVFSRISFAINLLERDLHRS